MSRFQDDKFQNKNKDNSNKNNTPTSSRFSDNKDFNSTQVSNVDGDVNSRLIISNTTNNGLQTPEKSGSNSRLIISGNKEDIDNSVVISPNAVSLSTNKENSTSTTRSKSVVVNLNKGNTSNNVVQSKGEHNGNSKLIISNTTNNGLQTPEKSGSNSKLKFDNGKETLKKGDKSNAIDDIIQEDVGTKKTNSKLIFSMSEERIKKGETVNFTLAENKKFEPTKSKRNRNFYHLIQNKDNDVELLQEFTQQNQDEYKTNKKQIYYSQGNSLVGNSRLYERDNASKLSITPDSKIEPSRKLQPTEKSQLAIKLYNKHNSPTKTLPYDIEQLKKYNFNFNLRSRLFSYNKANFKLRSTRGNFKLRSTRGNFNFDNANSKLTIEPKQIKLKSKKIVKVQKNDMSFFKASYKVFLKMQYAKAFRKSETENDNTKDTKTSQDIRAIKTNSKQTYKAGKFIIKTAQVLAKVVPLVISKVLALIASLMSFLIPFILPVIAIISVIIVVIVIILMIFLIITGIASESYLGEKEDILATENTFVQLEDKLKEELNNVGLLFPGYDQYDWSECDPNDIKHDPHELASYLTALLGAYTPETAQPEIEKLFNEMFKVEYKEIVGSKDVPVLDADGNPVLDADGNPVTTPVPTNTLKIILTTRSIKEIAKEWLTDEQYKHFEEVLKNQGHQEDLFNEPDADEILARSHDISTMIVETNNKPSIVTSHHMITNPQFAKTVTFGEQFLGMKYVFGGSTPETGFDCSGFISYILNQTGVASFPRTTAQGLYNMSTPVKNGTQQPGDLVFFEGTYNTHNTVTHVGLYVGNGMMLHCGDPIGYVNINSSAYAKSFYGFGRIG